MGKKGSWFYSLKRIFTTSSKDSELLQELRTAGIFTGTLGPEQKHVKGKKKWGVEKLSHGDAHSSGNKEPTTIEKILRDAERDRQIIRDLPSRDHQRSVPSPLPSREHQTFSLPAPISHRPANSTPRAVSKHHHIAAMKIQTAYRGYTARKNYYRVLKGLLRLRGVMRGQTVKYQTVNALKSAQLLVRVQSEIRSRRIKMMENQAPQRHHPSKRDKQLESSFTRWSLTPQSDECKGWDDSLLGEGEINAGLRSKVEAMIQRERQLAYAYCHQLWKASPELAYSALMEIRSGGSPWLWNRVKPLTPTHGLDNLITRATDGLTPSKPRPRPNTPLRPLTHLKSPKLGLDHFETATPKSSRSSPATGSRPLNHLRPRSTGPDCSPWTPIRDDDSLTSCPPLSLPNYMAPTASSKEKARAHDSPDERPAAGPPARGSKKRMPFGLGQGIGSIRWGKGFSNKGSSSSCGLKEGQKSINSIGNLSTDSTVSLRQLLAAHQSGFK